MDDAAQTVALTAAQRKIMSVLSDGKAHSREELFQAMEDPQMDMKTLAWHIFRIRERLATIGEGIECGVLGHGRGSGRYRHVKLDQ